MEPGADVLSPSSRALRKLVIRQNFNGSYVLYERLAVSEGILKQTCSELYVILLFLPRCRNVSPRCTPQSSAADGRPGDVVVVVAEAAPAAGSAQGVSLHPLLAAITWLVGS